MSIPCRKDVNDISLVRLAVKREDFNDIIKHLVELVIVRKKTA